MRSYLELIRKWEQFLSLYPEGNLRDFGAWLLENIEQDFPISIQNEHELQRYFDTKTEEHGFEDANSEASYLIWRLNKFLKNYTKSLFDDLNLFSQDEFAILSHVDYLQECSKKTAINDNLIDMSTGIDIIKRLIKRGLLKVRSNPEDQREKLISLSEAGKETLGKAYKGFSEIQNILIGLDSNSKNILVKVLKDLDQAHTFIWQKNL